MRHYIASRTPEFDAFLKVNPWGSPPKEIVPTITSFIPYNDYTFSSCCGSRVCTPENISKALAGVTVCFSKEKMVLPEDEEEYTYHQVEGDGEWIVFKLRHSKDAVSISSVDYYCPGEYGNVNSLYSSYLKCATENSKANPTWPDGVYLMILTREQDHDHKLRMAETAGLKVEWTSPKFSNQNYSDDPKRLTLYVLRKGEKK